MRARGKRRTPLVPPPGSLLAKKRTSSFDRAVRTRRSDACLTQQAHGGGDAEGGGGRAAHPQDRREVRGQGLQVRAAARHRTAAERSAASGAPCATFVRGAAGGERTAEPSEARRGTGTSRRLERARARPVGRKRRSALQPGRQR